MNRRILLVCQAPPPEASLERFYQRAFEALGFEVHLAGIKGPTGTLEGVFERARRRVARARHAGFPPDISADHLADLARTLRPHLTVVFRCERLQHGAIERMDALSDLGCVNVYSDSPFVIPGNSAVQMYDSLHAYSTVFTFARSQVPVFYQLGAR